MINISNYLYGIFKCILISIFAQYAFAADKYDLIVEVACVVLLQLVDTHMMFCWNINKEINIINIVS